MPQQATEKPKEKSKEKRMTSKLEFYIDDDGMHCARGDDERLATYLQTDIQGSTTLAEELISLLKKPDFSGEFTGNAHCVDFRDNSVLIEAMHDDDAPDRVLSRDDMLMHVQAWLEFISKP